MVQQFTYRIQQQHLVNNMEKIFTVEEAQSSKAVAVPHHVGKVSANIFENAVYEPVLVEVEGVYVDHFTGEDTTNPRWYEYTDATEKTILNSGDNKQKLIQPTYPGTDILAEKKGGGTFSVTIETEGNSVILSRDVSVSTLDLQDQADLIRISNKVRNRAVVEFQEAYGKVILPRP